MSTHCVSMIKNFNLSLKRKEEEEAISMEKQGIVSILDNVDSTSSNGEEDHHEQLIEDKPLKTFDIWSSILSSSKNEDSSNKLNPNSPYVHPLVKRSTSCLSKKSLEICTESLGSETGSGSDCFPSSPTSEREDSDNEKENHHHHHHDHQHSVVSESSEDFRVYNYNKRLLSSCRSFPPSLPSVHMQSHRQDGRLVLEAASIPPKNSLHAQRLDGHLLLTFINRNHTELEMENRDDEVEVFDDLQEVEGNETPLLDSGSTNEEEAEEEEEEEATMMEQVSSRISSDITNVNRAALMIQEKKNQPTWSKCTVSFSMTSDYFDLISRFNNSVNTVVVEEEKETSNIRECYTYPSSVPQTLPLPREVAEVTLAPPPPPPPPATATSLNAYEYIWRKKPTVANIVNCSTINKQYYNNKQVGLATTTNGTDTTKIAARTQDLVLIRGSKVSTMNNNLVPLLRSCKEPRKYLIIWEPHCIATS